MSKHLKKILAICAIFLFVFCVFITPSYAANRTGSHRSGGTNSHGKGSHYEGGHFIEQVSGNLIKTKDICINVKKSHDCIS